MRLVIWILLGFAFSAIPAFGQHSITLTWTDSATSGVTGQLVYRSFAKGGEAKGQAYAALPSSATSYVDSNVVAGQTYFYTVTAIVCQGTSCSESPMSNEATATTPTTVVAAVSGLSETSQ